MSGWSKRRYEVGDGKWAFPISPRDVWRKFGEVAPRLYKKADENAARNAALDAVIADRKAAAWAARIVREGVQRWNEKNKPKTAAKIEKQEVCVVKGDKKGEKI